MVQWSDAFWGEGNRGFEVLYSNIKNGAIAIEEFQRFLTESAQCESIYSKNLSRLQLQFSKISNLGTFTPIWNLIRDLLDKISSSHLVTVNFYQDLLRDIHNYQEHYQKKVKTQIQKDGDINRTAELIPLLNHSLMTVNKAKEQYYSIALDYERAKRGGTNSSNTSSSLPQENAPTSLAQSAMHSLATRHVERLERKYRQAQDEYKLTIEKYNTVRNDFEKRFSDAASKFQAFEIDHVEKMLAFSLNYADILRRNNEQIRLSENEFNDKLKSLIGNELLDCFVEQKKTGVDRPNVLQFEDIDHNKTTDVSSNSNELTLFNSDDPALPGFEANFPIPSLNTKPNGTAHRTHSPTTDSRMSPQSNRSTPMSPMNTNLLAIRSQDNNEQTTNPFIIIKKSKLPTIFGSRRKTEKSQNHKSSSISKTGKMPKFSRSNTKTSETNVPTPDLNDFTIIHENPDGLMAKPSKISTHSSSSISNEDTQHNLHKFHSSKSSTSSDSSDDDDDDNMMTKITFKINQPATQIFSDNDDDDNARIMNAMRLVDKNLGNSVLNSRLSTNPNQDISKSVSSGQINARSLLPRPPPPIVSRSITTIPSHNPTDLFDPANMFPPQDQFAQFPSNLTTTTTTNQENSFFPSQSISNSKNTTSYSSNEDDTEVANSFPTTDIPNKAISFPVLQVPRLFQMLRQQSTATSASPSINQSSNSSPVVPNELGTSPLTIGANEQIPLAIAFQETIHVKITGDNWKSRIVGQMLISFPSSMLNLLVDSSRSTNTLEFQLKNLDNIQNIVVKPSLIIQNQSSSDFHENSYAFDMTELYNILRNLQDKSPSSPFFNLNVLNYELKETDVSNIPIEFSSQWTRTFDTITIQIKYQFHSSILPETVCFQNNTVILYTIINDGNQLKTSSPAAEWSENEHKLWWKIPYVHDGKGTLSATLMTKQTNANDNDDTDEQPLTTGSILKVSFVGENTLFSSIDFELLSPGYRISLLKKKILSGKYQSEPDQSEPLNFFKRPSTLALPTIH